ncbi:hypothetical protein CFP56_005586 [Quercus suber]|uniref:Uncharacterized protein n=1 Tax=Quercus suber TaxID=58331 RepID=A0AAW0LB63_QUESU
MLATQMQLLRYTPLPGLCIVCYLLIFKEQTIPKCCQLKMQAYLLLVSERGHFKAAIFDDTVISVSTGILDVGLLYGVLYVFNERLSPPSPVTFVLPELLDFIAANKGDHSV